MSDPTNGTPADRALACARRHRRFGWWSLFCFLALGFVLEGLHGFKIGWYLDVSNETRRLMFTLAHAHGALLALLNIVFALSLQTSPEAERPSLDLVSRTLLAGSLVLPGGFFLGGLYVHGGDPGIGALLAPLGGLLLLAAIALHARSES